jgi:hypothetical protein
MSRYLNSNLGWQRRRWLSAKPRFSAFFGILVSLSKKSLHAAEQDRPDVAVARKAWFRMQPKLDPRKLVFIDETAASTNMTRRYGRATRGERLVCKVPHGHWKTSTFVAALRHNRVAAPFLLDGPMNGTTFLAYVEDVLVPTLKRGDIIIMDNVGVHKVAGVREAIERAAPPCSICRRTARTSTRSSNSSRSSSRCCARRPLGQSTRYGRSSAYVSPTSRRASAPLTSPIPDTVAEIAQPYRKML